ncbi:MULTISPECIES: carbohydrate ABC transporter permease [Shouchella]|uniref:L-arabinose transport system permease protein AraP n=3 Tax=Bacillaceae TaxID=186817 RepID=A0A060LVQ7_9BACI|nr:MULTISPECIES: sugar ABC transporter permease [Bacillaceae]RQW20197.1 sugar ABC transporter permease [Bacillus sp. C1-1]AIC94292.1 L-arabinose transport system permease protein AraP [Shouchella lehensis G1]KQL57800.1 hypothetical protein AN965_05600 [Alkalicoccobacillus plakortidis]MBG9785900.1 hypothetical protein [Shouchella lehensis]TES48371.1 sugar ABC transporter permease [Shouchella lehensis]
MQTWTEMKRNKMAYVFLLPWFLLFAVFSVYPLIQSFIYSFHDVKILRGEMDFVGLENYRNLLQDPVFGRALLNTFIYVVGTIPFTVSIALVLALAVNQRIPFKNFFRVGFFLPTVTSIIVVSMMFNFMYSPSGFLNMVLNLFQLPTMNWLMDTRTALASLMGLSVWMSCGFYMLIFLAGLQSIPKDLYEAATVDGASRWKQFWHVTLPHIRQIAIVVIVINTINTFQVFPEVYTLTSGGPLNATTTIVFYLYEEAFKQFQFGPASATAYVLFVIIMGISLLMLKIMGINKGVGD